MLNMLVACFLALSLDERSTSGLLSYECSARGLLSCECSTRGLLSCERLASSRQLGGDSGVCPDIIHVQLFRSLDEFSTSDVLDIFLPDVCAVLYFLALSMGVGRVDVGRDFA